MNKPSWLKDAIATPRGFVSKSGELLKSRRMTQAQIDEFNGTKKAAPKVEAEAPAVEETVSEKPVVKPKAKKKKTVSPKVADTTEETVEEKPLDEE